MAPFRGDPLRLGIVHGITWIFVDHIVEFEDLRLLGRKTVDDRDTILIVRAHVIERGVLVVRVNDQGGFGRAARRQIGARANFFGSHVAVTVPVGQGQIRSVWAHSRRDAHYRPFSKGTFPARHWTHLPWTEPPSGRAWVQIALPQFCLRLLDALAKVFLDDPALLFVTERFRGLRAATASGRAQ